jgi:hypothetical protein
MARIFQASFPGECAECGIDFDKYDLIGYDEDGEICCEECLLEDEAEIEEGVEGWKGFVDG